MLMVHGIETDQGITLEKAQTTIYQFSLHSEV